ncbi:DUF3455 domain-containing protein [Gloeobacter kilaueensis]|uniref:DUF3455 domain-containing protein n=1 Tax=Gloeobacter kilaueensis (strain ATCC BAA-2537 / CCAP 1431/1 / ULC 316 / JS1) TaxID=1183438 RepID=U5QEY7_GLOK1|nr:DUF3455 domain-containing protein [Gloeobacter kilaueensis]AGY57522.1 hypothetical protein GKIL_1276 [Gloeobacter kilaueensis JS1]
MLTGFLQSLLLAGPIVVVGSLVAPADIPAELQAPPPAELVRQVSARGEQLYECRAISGGAPAWTLVGPRAELFDEQGRPIGSHSVGPEWKADDGSAIRADPKALAKVEQPDAIAWLLLKVIKSSGNGWLTAVSYVQRLRTTGGVADARGCDAAHLTSAQAVPYTAIYAFYRTRTGT